MFQKSYLQYIEENPDDEFSKFLVKFFSRKPDLEAMKRDVEKFNKKLAQWQREDAERIVAEQLKRQEECK